jgi:tripartite-type tricarboxylate transporter receptor subunit TctC
VRAIAVTSPQRLPVLPDAPTMTEAGFAGLALDAWFGLLAPAGTPDAIIDKLNAAFVQAVRDPQVIKQMTDQGAEGLATAPAEFATFIASETERFGKVVRAVGVKPE